MNLDAPPISSGPGYLPWAQGLPAAARTSGSFADTLAGMSGDQDRAAVREAAGQFVSSAFIMPVLESLHESPFLDPPFAPSFAEKRFQPLLDQQIADRITTAANFPLVDVIVDRLLGEGDHS